MFEKRRRFHKGDTGLSHGSGVRVSERLDLGVSGTPSFRVSRSQELRACLANRQTQEEEMTAYVELM